MSRRMAASAIDATLVLSGFAAFAYLFFRINAELPPLSKIAVAGVLLIGLLWSAYQYLLLVYSGTTPGLKLARLELHRFDGSPVPLPHPPLARADVRALRSVAGPRLRLVLPRRRQTLLARPHHQNLHGAEENTTASPCHPRLSERSAPRGCFVPTRVQLRSAGGTPAPTWTVVWSANIFCDSSFSRPRSLRSLSHRSTPRGQRAHRAVQLALRPPERRHHGAAHRRHRRRTQRSPL